jgi:uncharacterized protein (DUF305 family)
MSPHHESAIEMAEVANEETSNPRIKDLTRRVTEVQEAEIEQMVGWREEWYPEGYTASGLTDQVPEKRKEAKRDLHPTEGRDGPERRLTHTP